MSARLRSLGLAAMLLAAIAGTLSLLHLRRQEEAARASSEALRRQVEALDREVRESRLLREELIEKLQRAGAAPPPLSSPREAPARDPGQLEAVRQLAALEKRVAELAGSNRELQARSVELQGTVDRLAGDNKAIQAESEDLRESLERTRRVVQATEAELKSKADRLAQMEGAISRLREENAGSAGQLRAISELIREYEELNRRRDNHLTNLQRRYRELTDLYRATMLTIEQQRDNPMASQLPDASRIQATVLSAEEDLRQLNALNSQAQRLNQRLRQRR